MININELTTDHKIKLKKSMGCFDNLGEVCEIVKIDTDENVINFRFGVDGVHLGVMSGDELEKYFDVIEPTVIPDDYEWHPYGFIEDNQVMYHALKSGSISMEMEQFLLCMSTLKILIGKLKMGKEVGFIVKI